MVASEVVFFFDKSEKSHRRRPRDEGLFVGGIYAKHILHLLREELLQAIQSFVVLVGVTAVLVERAENLFELLCVVRISVPKLFPSLEEL